MRWSEPATSSEDLLGRAPRPADHAAIRHWVRGQSIVVTGGGGSIGAELCRQCAVHGARRVTVVDIDEGALLRIDAELRGSHPGVECIPVLGDCGDPAVMAHALRLAAADAVFHAAAYKQVPLLEGQLREAVRNNVLATEVVLHASQAARVETFVLISTDKAVNPTNVMGATKRLAEMACEALGRLRGEGTQLEMVRFGNVLGSTGSVIPKFAEQIARGGPVTVTHPEINRYFMSIPEAAQLVLQAASMGHGGEVFVLDMGAPVKIVDLARNMIRLSGYTEDEIRIEFSGLRPGEKLYEELLADAEETRETPHPKLRIARSRPVPETFLDELTQWLSQPGPVSDDEVRAGLKRWVPEYQPARH